MDSTTVLRLSSILGITSSLILSGTYFGSSQLTVPILLRLPTATSTDIFQEFYYRGVAAVVPLAATSTISCATAAYLDPAKRTKYLTAAVLTASAILWTVVFMGGVNSTLIKASGDDGFRKSLGDRKVVELLESWKFLNMCRAVLSGVGGLVGMLALVDVL